MNSMTFHILGIMIPTDFQIFFRGVGQPPTRKSNSLPEGQKNKLSDADITINNRDGIRGKKTSLIMG